jgi:CheY-like chemotaxis protein/HPt (histidine-containing phosphotransfer) domain-containing protein
VRVLVVDDNATNREILRTRLVSWGMRSTEAAGAAAGLELLVRAFEEGDPFRVAVLDMQMPDMNGLALGEAIRGDARLKGTRLVMLTSVGMRGDAELFANAGFNGYLTKPVRHLELHQMLGWVLAAGESQAMQPAGMATRHTLREAMPLVAGRKARVLLAEDNPVNQQVALGILEKIGVRVDAVATGAEALQALQTTPYDLVLMDVQMPVMDGLEATRRIRDPGSAVLNHRIPIVAMTANAMKGDRERCLEAGMNDYVAKPVDPFKLVGAVRTWLGGGTEASQVLADPVPAAESPAPLVFDRPGFLSRVMDNERIARKVIAAFLPDTTARLAKLQQVLEAKDPVALAEEAHSLKGSSANVGGEAMRQVALALEMAGKAGNLAEAPALLAQLQVEFARLKALLEAENFAG